MSHLGRFTVALLLAAGLAVSAAAQQAPRFQSSVEVTSLDVTVVDGSGHPVSDLAPADFTVRVGGANRRVLTAQWIPLAPAPGTVAPPPPPAGYSSNQTLAPGRLIVIAVDEPNIRPGNAGAVLQSVASFVDGLQPADRIAAVSLGIGGAATPFTDDRNELKRAIGRMPGQSLGDSRLGHNIGLSEAIDISADASLGAGYSLSKVAARECGGLPARDRQMCMNEIENEAFMREQLARQNTSQTISSLRQILTALKAIDAPKTLVLVSGGLVLFDEESDVLSLGSLAAAARTSVYVLTADDLATDTSIRIPGAALNDRTLLVAGLDLLAGASRGTVLNILGNGTAAVAQVEAELSGYYLLGVESDPADKDGKPHSVNVSVNRRGLSVRSRSQILAIAGVAPPSAHAAVTAGLVSPLILSGLPLRVATFSVREPETQKVQLLIHADIGTDYSAAKPVSLGYVITDKKGNIVDTLSEDARLPPTMVGVPSPLQFVSTASLEPGDYGLKMSVIEGDRAGTVEHVFHAGLGAAGPVALSDLMVGGPATTTDLAAPTVGYMVNFGTVHGYLEAYGPGSDSVTVKYEVAASETAEPLLQADASARTAGNERRIFSNTISVGRLPPGKYFLRAVVSSGAQPVKTMARAFEVAPPPVLMTSANNAAVASTTTDVYLPVADTAFLRAFHREDAARGDTLRLFRESVTPASRDAFDKGAAFLSSGDYTKAEETFKTAIRADDQSSVALAYLAATYAASGHDTEAAGAWQTSLIDASEFPQIYEWLADTLLRLHDLSGAKTVLEEAAAKWPADIRFAKPMALVYATLGQGVEAVRMLTRHLSAHEDDGEGLSLGVEWIYHLHSAGAAAQTPAADAKLASTWADAYLKAKGPQSALVKQWIQAIETNSQRPTNER